MNSCLINNAFIPFKIAQMKRYINLRLKAFLLALVFLLPGCSKYIDLEPQNATYDEVFWVSGANVQKAVSGAYGLLRSSFLSDRSYFIFGDVAADNFDVSGFWNYTAIVQSGGFRFSYVPYLEASLKNWTRFYSVINQCHLIIENTSKIDVSEFADGESQRKRLEGEARFLRAYTYFYMQRVWGYVVMTKESFKDPDAIRPIPRSPEEEVLAYCIADLEAAAQLLDNSGEKMVANQGAALALLAEIYAWKHDYMNAEKYCNEVMSKGYSLESLADYKKIWQGNSKESIFELNMLFDAVSNEATSGFFNIFLTDPYIRNKAINDAWPVGEEMRNKFEEGDKRADSIMTLSSGGNNKYILTKYDGVNYYDPNNTSNYVVSNNLVLIRLADIYLLRAEARYKNGNITGAQDDLNLIRARADLGAYNGVGEDLFHEIFDERRRELLGEGHAMFDMIRMEQLQRLFSGEYSNDRMAKKGYYWPLDMRNLLPQNELLTQNEWWKSN